MDRFDVDGVSYASAEHFMMAEKVRLFNDVEAVEKNLTSRTPVEAKKIGRVVNNFVPDV